MIMFRNNRFACNGFVKKGIICGMISMVLGVMFLGYLAAPSPSWAEMPEINPEELIRFHVIANSDEEEDQLLKYAVRDALLKEAAPRLAKSTSLDESRMILQEMEGKLKDIAQSVVREWNRDYPVTLEYGRYTFPAKSYGNIVLPSGEYEALKINIGEARGANWWCVLFPPLCFVNVEEAASLPVDGKPAVPLDTAAKAKAEESGKKQIGFYFARFFK